MKNEQLIEPQRVDGRRVSESGFCISLRPSLLCGLVLGVFAASVTAAPVDFGRDVRPFLEQHCVSCQGPKKEKGGVRFDSIGPASQKPEFAQHWQEAREQLLNGEMPPEDEKQPSAAQKQAIVAWIDAELERAQREWASTGGKVVMRRLNRNEYEVNEAPSERQDQPENPRASKRLVCGQAIGPDALCWVRGIDDFDSQWSHHSRRWARIVCQNSVPQNASIREQQHSRE